jgi:hypothetical protein
MDDEIRRIREKGLGPERKDETHGKGGYKCG